MLHSIYLSLFELIMRAGGDYIYYYDPAPRRLHDLVTILLSPGMLKLLALAFVIWILVVLISGTPRVDRTISTLSADDYAREAEAYRAMSRQLDQERQYLERFAREMQTHAEFDERTEATEHEKAKRDLQEKLKNG